MKRMFPIYKALCGLLLIVLSFFLCLNNFQLTLNEENFDNEDGNCGGSSYFSKVLYVGIKCSMSFFAGFVIGDYRLLQLGAI
jgi:hypothetical protein